MTVIKYKKMFLSLSYFAYEMHLSDYAMATMFENNLYLRYLNMVLSKRLLTLGIVICTAQIMERDKQEDKK